MTERNQGLNEIFIFSVIKKLLKRPPFTTERFIFDDKETLGGISVLK